MADISTIGFNTVDGRNVGQINIFALSTCGWCKKTKEFFDSHGIAYSYVDVDTVPENEEDMVVDIQMEFNPSGSFPTIVLNGSETIVGYDLDRLEELAGK